MLVTSLTKASVIVPIKLIMLLQGRLLTLSH